jgi:4-hydroxybenzoate polyprenyltransferase
MRGRAFLKHKLAESCDFDPATLPYRSELVDDLHTARSGGRTLVLATAADSKIANRIAEHLGLFDYVLASNGETNLKGESKREALAGLFGSGKFDYVGDSPDDIAIWESARSAWIISHRGIVEWAKHKRIHVTRVYVRTQVPTWKAILRLLRPHHWLKNLLIFLPIAAAHSFLDWTRWFQASLMFVAFSMAASAGYIVNDLLDVRSDRVHRSKRTRPFASGDLPLSIGLAAPVLILLALAVSIFLPGYSVWIVATYLAVSLLYSKLVKSKAIADVVVLAFLYCLRIMAGGEAARIPVSIWLLTMATFIFLSLAFAKRSTELRTAQSRDQLALRARGYNCADLPIVDAMGVSSGYLSAVVMMLYLQSTDVVRLYRHPLYLWLVVPILISWIGHVWLTAHRGEMNDDPLVFAVTNSTSLLLIAAVAAVMVAAI